MQLGVHYALSAPQEQQLLAASGDDEVMELVEEIEESGESLHVDTDKAWDAIHRCLSDGTLDREGGEYPLSHAILGGRQLYDGEDYFVSYVSADQVHDVSAALAQIDESAYVNASTHSTRPTMTAASTRTTSSTPGPTCRMWPSSSPRPLSRATQ